MNDQAGQTRARTVAAVVLTLCAVPAAALTPPPPCQWDFDAQRLVTVIDGVYAPAMADAYPAAVGEGFVSFSIFPGALGADAGEWFVLQHCRTGQELLIALPAGDTRQFHDVYEDMVFGNERYTMRQIGETLSQMGAGARLTQNEFGSCGCDQVTDNG